VDNPAIRALPFYRPGSDGCLSGTGGRRSRPATGHPRFLTHGSDKTPGEVFLECRAAEGLLFRAVQRHHPARVVNVPAAIAAGVAIARRGTFRNARSPSVRSTPTWATAPGYPGVFSKTRAESRSRLTPVARSLRQPFRAEMAPDPWEECFRVLPILNVQWCGCSSNPPEGTARNMAHRMARSSPE
jgi:hypothetical protein